MRVRRAAGLLIVGILALAGCGGGGGGSAALPATTVLSGIAAKGPISGGTLKAYAIVNGVEDRSAPIGQGSTDAGGNYRIDVGNYQGPVLVEVSGGSYVDEVSGATVTLKSPLRAVLSNASIGAQSVAVTPLTELAYKRALGGGGLTPAAIDEANATIAAFFKLSGIVSSLPLAGSTDDNRKKYAFVLGALSQLCNDRRNSGETLDDAVGRIIVQICDELKGSGGFSSATLASINAALTGFANGGKNQTGASITPIAAPASGLLKLTASGPAGTIGAIDAVINLPAGVTVKFDPLTGEAGSGVVTVSGVAASGSSHLSIAKYTPAAGAAPAQLKVLLINAAGFAPGEFVAIRFDVAAGAAFPASAASFTLASFSATGLTGSRLPGVTAAASSVALALN